MQGKTYIPVRINAQGMSLTGGKNTAQLLPDALAGLTIAPADVHHATLLLYFY